MFNSQDDETVYHTGSFKSELLKFAALRNQGLSLDVMEAVSALPKGSALMVSKNAPGIEARFLLDTDLTVAGRHPEVDIFLDDITVSRKHAEFKRDNGMFTLRDLGSLNGIFVNSERIESAVLLNNGDVIQIGKFKLMFFVSLADIPDQERA